MAIAAPWQLLQMYECPKSTLKKKCQGVSSTSNVLLYIGKLTCLLFSCFCPLQSAETSPASSLQSLPISPCSEKSLPFKVGQKKEDHSLSFSCEPHQLMNLNPDFVKFQNWTECLPHRSLFDQQFSGVWEWWWWGGGGVTMSNIF